MGIQTTRSLLLNKSIENSNNVWKKRSAHPFKKKKPRRAMEFKGYEKIGIEELGEILGEQFLF